MPNSPRLRLSNCFSHSSGLADAPALLDLVNRSYLQEGNMDEVRYWMVKGIAPKPLDHARGSKFDYSNLGYIIAGAILERPIGTSFPAIRSVRASLCCHVQLEPELR